EVGGLQERALLGELLDRVAAVEEHARVAVDVGDAAGARGRVREGGVVGDEPQRAEIGGTDRAVLDRDLVPPPGAVVGDGERVLRHGHLPWRGIPTPRPASSALLACSSAAACYQGACRRAPGSRCSSRSSARPPRSPYSSKCWSRGASGGSGRSSSAAITRSARASSDARW